MKVPAILLSLALASSAVAQLEDLPDCARGCVNELLRGGIGNCGMVDFTCICGNEQFIGSISCCLAGVCDAAAQSAAVSVAANICGNAGVTGLPTAVTCSTATGSATPATTPADTTATVTAETTVQTTAQVTGDVNAATTTTSQSTNYGPRPTAAAGLGAIGGIIAALALL